MKEIIITLFGVFMSITLLAQIVVVKEDGKVVRCKDIQLKEGYMVLKVPKKGKVELKYKYIKGYYYEEESEMLYKIDYIDENGEKDTRFLRRIVSGKLNLYQFSFGTTNYITEQSSSSVTLFLEKEGNDLLEIQYSDNSYLNLRGRYKRKEYIERLTKFVEDDPQTIQLISSTAYKHIYYNVINTIRKYNLRSNPTIVLTSDEVGKITFFRRRKGQAKKNLSLTIGDKEYTLTSHMKVDIELPTNSLTKVCLKIGNENICDLISASDYFDKYYEVKYDNGESIRLIREDKKFSMYYTKSMK